MWRFAPTEWCRGPTRLSPASYWPNQPSPEASNWSRQPTVYSVPTTCWQEVDENAPHLERGCHARLLPPGASITGEWPRLASPHQRPLRGYQKATSSPMANQVTIKHFAASDGGRKPRWLQVQQCQHELAGAYLSLCARGGHLVCIFL